MSPSAKPKRGPKSNPAPDPPVGLSPLPEGYADWLAELKGRIHAAQQRASLAVNCEMLLLYWQIGRDILARQAAQGWGAKVIDRLAHDLRTAFPDMKGFSPRNLKYMRAFADAWPDEAFVQQAVARLPWGHNLVLLDRLPGPETRKWYAAKALAHNWSRNVLTMQIETRLLERSGAAATNFDLTLPQPQSDLARESLKDPYKLDFLGLTDEAQERAVEGALVRHVTEFLLELAGHGERRLRLDLVRARLDHRLPQQPDRGGADHRPCHARRRRQGTRTFHQPDRRADGRAGRGGRSGERHAQGNLRQPADGAGAGPALRVHAAQRGRAGRL
jgi:predicted nuclease of restriction endonuclease-like (RecB) superfamily